jgi:IS1 family transposase
LAEGNSIRSISRFTRVHKKTVLRLLVDFGGRCRDFLSDRLRGLTLRHVQCDEIWTFVAKKQGRLPVEERGRYDIGDQYVWVAFDQDTKLVPAFAVGKRSADMCRRFMVDLAGRLVRPKPHASDAHAFQPEGYRPIVQLSTDAYAAYREAVDLAFGPHVEYGQLIKDYRNVDQPGRYAPPEMIATERRVIRGEIEPFEICTSHVERNNLTMRTFLKRFQRLSLGFSKKLANLIAAVSLHFAYYNFCWKPATLGKITPAMAAGVVNRPWRMDDLFAAVATT